MVDKQYLFIFRQIPDSDSNRDNNTSSYLQNRVGSYLQQCQNSGWLEFFREDQHVNVLELKAIHLAFLVFTKGQNQYTFKYTIFVLSHKRHSKSANIGEFAEEICYRGNFDFFIEQEHSNYSRVVLSKQVEREAYQDYRRIIDYPE